MAKKKFKETRFGKFLHGITREVPLVGGVVDHVKSDAPADGGEKGKIDGATLSGQVVAAIVVLLGLAKSFGLVPAWVVELAETVLANIQF